MAESIWKRTRRTTASLLGLALIATACGGDASENDDPADPEETSEVGEEASDDDENDVGEEVASGDFDTDANLVFFSASGNDTLDPAHAQNNSSLSQELLLLVYDRLVHFEPATGDPGPGLATSWEYNDDMTQFTMQLRDDVVFHDGEAFNADAVIANLDRYAYAVEQGGENAGATVTTTVGFMESWEATGEYEVVVDLVEPTGQFEFYMGMQAGMMLSPASFEGNVLGIDIPGVGSGPYMVADFETNVRTDLERNDDYWDGYEGRPATFELHYVPDGQARLNAVQSGEANISVVDATQIPEVESAGLEVQVNQQQGLWHIYSNHSGVMGDRLVRQAFAHSIDREGLAEAFGYGSTFPAWQIIPEGSPVYLDELHEYYPYDIERAQELLAEAGYEDGVDIEFILLNTTEYNQLAEALQQMVAEAGFNIEFEVVDVSQAVIFRGEDPQGDMMMARWGGRSDPLMTFQDVYWAEGTYTPGGSVDPQVDELIEQAARMSVDDPARMDLLHDINRLVTEESAQWPMLIRSLVYAFEPGCIDGLETYLALGSDDPSTLRVVAGC